MCVYVCVCVCVWPVSGIKHKRTSLVSEAFIHDPKYVDSLYLRSLFTFFVPLALPGQWLSGSRMRRQEYMTIRVLVLADQ